MKRILTLLMAVSLTFSMLSVNLFAMEANGTGEGAETAYDLYNYLWEMDSDVLTSRETAGNTYNPLTLLSGSVSNGTLKNVRYSLEREVRLYHDVPWVIEWRGSGNWSGMLLSNMLESSVKGMTYLFRDPGSKIFSFGEYNGSWNNYGMVLELDMSISHVFRLENRIDEFGLNRVYLVVDGQEMGSMDHHYISAKDQNKTVDWAVGKDLVFTHIGTSSHAMRDLKLDYLWISEKKHEHIYTSLVTPPTNTHGGYTTYTCTECGHSYVDGYTAPLCDHVWTEWTQITAPACDSEGRDGRVCTDCGWEQNRDTRITGDPKQILVSNPVDKDYFKGKTLLTIGDSITYGVGTTKTYGAFLAESLGVKVINKGISGSGYCSGGKMTTNNTLTVANVRNADIITIMLGVNDWAWAVKEGSWNGNPNYYDKSFTYYQLGEFQSTDPSTFYGALHQWCQNISDMKEMEGFEEKEFIVITPLITSWNNSVGQRIWDQDKKNIHGHSFREYCTAIMEVCAYYRIPVFDANMYSGIYYRSPEDNNVDLTGGDGVHVNENGHALLAKALEEFLVEGYSYESRTVPQGGHNYVDGLCQDCRLPYVCPHVYDSEMTAPTCTEEGYTRHVCVHCGEAYVDSYVAPKGHETVYVPKDGESHFVTCQNCDCSEEEKHNYIGGTCVCGEAGVNDPVLEDTWEIGHTLNLESNISVNFVILKSALEGFSMDTVYMESVLETYEGNELRGTETIRLLPVDMGYFYYFTLNNITSMQMNDKISSVLYGRKEGQEYFSPVDEYSIATYCYNMLNNSTGEQYENLRTLLVDLLHYGAKTQLYMNYRTDSLCDGALTEEQLACGTQSYRELTNIQDRAYVQIPEPTAVWLGAGLNLRESVAIRFKTEAENYEGFYAEIQLAGETYRIPAEDFDYRADGTYIHFRSLTAAQMSEAVYVTIYCGEEPVSNTIRYSIESYAYAKQNDSNPALAELVKAMMAYGDSAKAYKDSIQ